MAHPDAQILVFLSCTVLLQAMKEDPPLNVKCKDKFLVQSTVITPEKESLALNELVRLLFLQGSKVFLILDL